MMREIGRINRNRKFLSILLVFVLIWGLYGNSGGDVKFASAEAAEITASATDAYPRDVSTNLNDASVEVIDEEDISTVDDLNEDTIIEDDSTLQVSEEDMITEDISEDANPEESVFEEISIAEFNEKKLVDGVEITVTADAGVFPEGATLYAKKVSAAEEASAIAAVDKVREEEKNVAESYTFDIKVLDSEGNEIQPDTSRGSVRVSFAMPEISNANLDADIYHISGHGTLVAEELNSDVVVSETSDIGVSEEVTAETDGFSYYTVEFTYNEKQYVMQGDSTVALTDILDYVGITKADGSVAADSDITAVSVSNESLFSASDESGEWIVTAHQAFHTDECMKVTIDGVEYEIVVTDDAGAGEYVITVSSSYYKNYINLVMNGNWVNYTVKSIIITLKDANGENVGEGTISGSSGTVTINTSQEVHSYFFTIVIDGGGGAWQETTNLDDGEVGNYTFRAVDWKIQYTATHPAAHSHNWSYSANNNIITAHCNGSGTCSVGDQTLTLGTVSDKMYNGTAQTVPSYTTSDGWTTANGLTDPGTVTVSPANSANAGTYTASVSAGDATAKSSWTINKANITPSVTMNGWTYGGTASNPSVSGNLGNGSVTYQYKVSTAADSTYTGTKPSSAGTYTVKANVAATTNYNAGTATTNFTIGNASMTGVSATGYTGTYDAAAHSINVTAPSGTTVKYRTASSGDYNLTTNPTFTDAGTYTVYYQVTKANYTAVTGSATVKINPIELTLTWSDNNAFIYNGSSQAPTATIDGVINNDDCAVSVSGAQTNYSGAAYTATAELIGERAGNYALPTAHTMTFTIGKKDATITASDQTITYGEAIATGTGYITTYGFVSEDLPTAITLTQNTSDVTTSGTITPSAATIKNGTTDVTDNYNIAYHTGNLTINKKTITISGITASNKTYDGTTAATLSYDGINWTACGMVAGDDLSVTATGAFLDASVGTGKTVTITGLTLGGAKAGNYELAANGQQTSTTADINKKAITITADSDSKVYDGTAHKKNSYSITSGGLAVGDSIESVTVTGSQTFVGNSNNVPDAAVIKNSSDVNVTGNYDIIYTNGTLTVTKKPLTITADSDTKVYDATALTNNGYTSTGLAEGDTFENVTVTGSQTSVGSSDNVPSAAVIKKGDEDVTANYDITYVNGTLKVTKKEVTITADSDTKVYDGTALTNGGYTVTGLESGDRIDSVTISGSQTVAGETANEPSAAVIKNSADEVVNDNYVISYVNGTLEVTKKAITITADSDTKVYDGTALVKDGYSITNGELATGDSIDGITISGTQTVAGEGANAPSEAVIKNENGDDVTASYDITYANGTLEVTKKAVTITADDAAKVYDGTPLTKEGYTNSNLAAGDTVESVIVTGSQTDAGESVNVPSAAVIKNAANEDVTASYDITYENGTLEVTKKPVTISGITAEDKIYDGTTAAELDYSDIDWISCGMVEGDELSVIATGTFGNSNAGTDKGVAITDIILGGESIDNYELADSGHQSLTTADIIKKEVTVTALKQTVAVNGKIENSVDMAELSGVLEGHVLAEITLTSGSTEKTTTEGVITPSKAKIIDGDTDVTDNYDITYIDGVMTVTKAEAEVILDNGDDEAPASVTAVEVPNLLELADEESEEGRLVKVELSVKPVSENNVSSTTVSNIKNAIESLFAFVDMESIKVEYLEIDLTKYIDNMKDSTISDTGTPLEIILTYDTSKVGNPVIIRNHEGTVKVFTQLSSRPTGSLTDATYYVDGDKIYMYSQYFSDFAIAYSIEKTFNVSLDDGNGNIIRQIVSEGTKFTPPTDLTRDGYDFGGWYKDEAHTQKWDPDTDKVTSDIKLYAKWEKKETSTTDTPATKVDTPTTEASKTDTSNKDNKISTGDKMNIGIVVMLMLDSGIAALYLALRKKMLK